MLESGNCHREETIVRRWADGSHVFSITCRQLHRSTDHGSSKACWIPSTGPGRVAPALQLSGLQVPHL